MIRRTVWLQLVAFVVISAAVALYLGIGILRLPVFTQPFTVSMVTAETGGLFPNALVTYRGVEVGKVASVELVKGEGVRTRMAIAGDVEVPDDLVADISAFSAIGEQYVNLEPTRAGPPYLQDGDVIGTADTRLPPQPAAVLADLDAFLGTLDTEALAVVVGELGQTFDGLASTLQQVLDSTQRITGALQDTLPETVGVIQDGGTVLDGQLGQQGSIRSFADDLEALSAQLVESDPDLRRLFVTGTEVTEELQLLLDDPTRAALAVLLGNLITTNEVLVARIPALQQLAIVLPDSLSSITTLVGDGNALPIDVFFDDVERCDYGTPEVPPEQSAADPPPPFVDQRCPSSAGLVRGARNAPRPPGTAVPEGSDSQAEPYRGGQGAATYSPTTGRAVGPDGAGFTLSSSAGYAPSLGAASWTTLLLSGLAS